MARGEPPRKGGEDGAPEDSTRLNDKNSLSRVSKGSRPPKGKGKNGGKGGKSSEALGSGSSPSKTGGGPSALATLKDERANDPRLGQHDEDFTNADFDTNINAEVDEKHKTLRAKIKDLINFREEKAKTAYAYKTFRADVEGKKQQTEITELKRELESIKHGYHPPVLDEDGRVSPSRMDHAVLETKILQKYEFLRTKINANADGIGGRVVSWHQDWVLLNVCHRVVVDIVTVEVEERCPPVLPLLLLHTASRVFPKRCCNHQFFRPRSCCTAVACGGRAASVPPSGAPLGLSPSRATQVTSATRTTLPCAMPH